ncbi:hypothetical protein NMG60_11026653 [Bertholletia excelsa]
MASRLGPMKTDRSLLMSFDDSVLMNQIQSTHSPDCLEVDARSTLSIVEHILHGASTGVASVLPGMHALTTEPEKDKAQQAGAITMLEATSYTIIDRIAYELSSMSLSSRNGHQTTLSLLNIVSTYSWDAKLVLTLAAFALNYGEFWLLAQHYSSNQFAKSMAILKQVSSIMEHSGQLKQRFDDLNSLIRAMIDLCWRIVFFSELPAAYIKHDEPALKTAWDTIPKAVYWCMRAVVTCVTQITGMGHEQVTSSTMETREVTTLTHKIKTIHEHLEKQFSIIDDMKHKETYEALQQIFRMVHIDNTEVLKALIYVGNDIQPLYYGSTKSKVNLDVLRRKNVLLLISSLDISEDELLKLCEIYNAHAESDDSMFKVVWIPIVERMQWTDPMQKQFEFLQSSMPWYTVYYPSKIEPAVVRFIKEKWHFRNKPIMVVLDPQGGVVNPNAIHMMRIWGSYASPFTSRKEEALWKQETWRLELLVDGIDDQLVLNSIQGGKYIMLYGGDDIEYIRKLTAVASAVASAEKITLKMVYAGKSTMKEKVRQAIATINSENLSNTWHEAMIWFFWIRLESMLFSKIQLGKEDDSDTIIQEIKKLLSYDREDGWAVLAHGSEVVVNGHGSTMMRTFAEYDPHWKQDVLAKGFDNSFRDYHNVLHKEALPCCQFEFPSTIGRIPEGLKCPECFRVMGKYTTHHFLCYHSESTMASPY